MTVPQPENTLTSLYTRIISENSARPSVISSATRLLEQREKPRPSLMSGLTCTLSVIVALLIDIKAGSSEKTLAALHDPISYSRHMLSTTNILQTNLFIIAISAILINFCIAIQKPLRKKARQRIADQIIIATSPYSRQYFRAILKPLTTSNHLARPTKTHTLTESLRQAWRTATAHAQPINSAIIAEAISRRRQELHYTQQHLADASGVTIRTVQRVEKTGEASPETLRNICASLDIRLDGATKRENLIRKIRHHLSCAVGTMLVPIPLTIVLNQITKSLFTDASLRTHIEYMGIIYQFLALPTAIGLSFAVWHTIKAYQIWSQQEHVRLLNNIALLMPSIILSITTTYATFHVIPLSAGITDIIDETKYVRQLMNQKDITHAAMNLATTRDEKNCIRAFEALASNEFWNNQTTNPPTQDLFPDSQHPEKTKIHFFNNFWIHYSLLTSPRPRHPGPLADYHDPSAFARETETCYQLSIRKIP